MNIDIIQQQLDALYEESLDNAYAYMMDIAIKAMNEDNEDVLLFILNELIGYYRVTSQINEGEKVAQQLINILKLKGYEGTLQQATSYLNIATMYRAFGKFEQALALYQETEKIYLQLNQHDLRLSAFYNNYSLLYMQQKEYRKAIDLACQALKIVEEEKDYAKMAVSYSNLAQMYILINQKDKAEDYVEKAIFLFENYTDNDSHYYSALATKGQYECEMGHIEEALVYYEQAIQGVEKVYGHSQDYETLVNNKKKVMAMKNRLPKGLEICQKYYETYGKKLIDEKYASYKQYMAIGMFGYGSDCLGYDDEISKDHDFGGGFCILLPSHIYQKIGKELQVDYEKLPDEFMGVKRLTSLHGQGRVGVFEIDQFFLQFLNAYPQSLHDWLYLDEQALLNCTNGIIFDDYYGKVTKIREELAYYPEEIRIKKIALTVAKIAQSGQYNYGRCMTRHDYVAANLALNEFIDQTLSLIYLMNKQYKPYYKWSFYGLKDCVILYDIKDCLEKLAILPCQKEKWNQQYKEMNKNDEKVRIIEYICQCIVEELNKAGLSHLKDDFLDNHVGVIMSHMKDNDIEVKNVMEG